mmetsp:Transcript_22229/g.53859  ORF Transcript_22229/g.53859 Transcript_22229/m.53859 type:complete len:434 (-) Transcript_22229:338-1639(-)
MIDRRAALKTTHSLEVGEDDTKEPISPGPARRKSSILVDALSDPNSELARFLLANSDKQDDEERGFFDGFFNNPLESTFKSFRNIGRRMTADDNVIRSQKTSKSWFYSLALEPMEVRKDRIIMLAEAYAIFGALFLAGTFVLYEWGSGYGYGGCRLDEGSYCHKYVDRAFELVMTLLIVSNLFQAMFSSFLWIMSILFSSSHHNWVYGARHLLVICHLLLCCIFVLTLFAIGLGVWAKLAPYWPEVAIAFTFLLIVVVSGMYTIAMLVSEECALEYFHFPAWFKWGLLPYPLLSRGGGERIRQAAERRAKEVRARAYNERTLLKMNTNTSSSMQQPTTSVGRLLRDAADSIGRHDTDISAYELRLEEDWYNNASELANMSVDSLSKYMPRRLAEEVRNEMAMNDLAKGGGFRASYIASGSFSDDGHKRTVRFE